MFFSRKKQKPKPVAESLDLRNTQESANATRERLLEKDIGRLCAEWFPDNEDKTWRILRMLHAGERSYAEVEPEPKNVGCDKLVFLFEFVSGDVDHVPLAVWCLEGDGYYLLSTAPECKFQVEFPGKQADFAIERAVDPDAHPGVYGLRSNQSEWDEAQLWRTYTMLTDLEAVFRSLKSELGMRPVSHQKTHRVKGHIFITLLAYNLVHQIRLALKARRIDDSWETIRKSQTVVP